MVLLEANLKASTMSSLFIEKSRSVVCQLVVADAFVFFPVKILLYFFEPVDFDSNRLIMVEWDPYGTFLFSTGGGYL